MLKQNIYARARHHVVESCLENEFNQLKMNSIGWGFEFLCKIRELFQMYMIYERRLWRANHVSVSFMRINVCVFVNLSFRIMTSKSMAIVIL